MSTEFKTLFDKELSEKFYRTLTSDSFGDKKFIFNKKNKDRWRKKLAGILSCPAYKLYGYFEYFINNKFVKYFCFPSWETIIKQSKLSRSSINRALKELEQKRFIAIFKAENKTTKYTKNIYFLMEYIGEEQLKFYIEVFKLVYDIEIQPKVGLFTNVE